MLGKGGLTMAETKQNKEYTIILSESQINNLIEFFDFQFIDSIRNDSEVDNMSYLCDMCDIYQSLKKTIKQ